MDQNGKPDLLSVQSVSAFISQAWLSDTLPLKSFQSRKLILKLRFDNQVKCTESKAEEKSVLEQYGLVNDLIEEIKALTLDYPDRKPQLINAIEQLNAMKAKRLGELN